MPATLDEHIRRIVEYTTAKHGGNKTKAAEELGISYRTMQRMYARYKAEDAIREKMIQQGIYVWRPNVIQ